MVTDPFQIGSDLEAGAENTQISSNRLLPGDQGNAAVFDFDLHPVDYIIASHYRSGQILITLGQSINCILDCRLNNLAHANEVLAQRFQILIKIMSNDSHAQSPLIRIVR